MVLGGDWRSSGTTPLPPRLPNQLDRAQPIPRIRILEFRRRTARALAPAVVFTPGAA